MTLNYFSENLERFERIKEVFAASKPLQESIGKLYHDITQFATQTAVFYSQSRLSVPPFFAPG